MRDPHSWTPDAVMARIEAKVGRLARWILGRDADDGRQEVFLAIHRALPGFRGDAAVETWAHRIAVRTLGRMVERRRRQVAREEELTEDGCEAQAALADFRANPFDAAGQKEVARAVREGLAALPEHERVVLVLRTYEAMPYAEIAATLEIPVGTVKSRIASGMARLGKWLQSRVEVTR